MNKDPLVSILIPTYNQPDFFRLALESAINQDYPNIEIVVSDDSTDDRVKNVFDTYKDCGRLMRYLKHEKNPNDKLPSEKAISNFENLLDNAKGEFVQFLLHDDLLYPQKISRMMKFFMGKDADKIAIVSSVRNWIDDDGKVCGESDTFDEMNLWENGRDFFFTGEEVGRIILMIYGNFVGELSTVLIRRKDYYRNCVSKFSTRYFLDFKDRTMGDVTSWLEICKDGRGLIFLRDPLSAFRFSKGVQNSNNIDIRMTSLMEWLAFITISYVRNCYLHNSKDLEWAFQHWILITARTSKEFLKAKNINCLDSELIETITQVSESITSKDYDLTLNFGIEWIRKFSSDTCRIEKYIAKNSRGLWCKRED